MKNENEKFFVSRQAYWPDGKKTVEICTGGLDNCNPDALVAKYDGEFQGYLDPREAVKTAIEIRKQWSKDSGKRIVLGIGDTLGFTMPFDAVPVKDAIKWAETVYESMPKCAQCGELLGEETWRNDDSDFFETAFCSEYCAEKDAESIEELNPEIKEYC